ncbi:MAG: hypothetical protein HDS73_05935 [Bacteroidales bacterium]|nr:hypothetical protein [Bacteroidales bacterium]
MKRMLLQWSATALAVAAVALPLTAENEYKRQELPGATYAPNKVKVENRRQILNLQRLNQRMRLTTESLIGPSGQMEIPTKSAPKAINHLATRSAEAPRGKAYALVPSHSMAAGLNAAMFGEVDLATGRFSQIYRGVEYSLGEDYNYLTTCIVDGIVYIPAYTQNMVTNELASYWRRIDLESGQQLDNIEWGAGDISGFYYALTYNPEKKKFYGLGMNLATGTTSELYEIDLTGATPRKEYLGNLESTRVPGMAASLCYNPNDGELYTIKSSGKMYIVPQEFSPTLVEVKQFSTDISQDEFKFIPEQGYSQPLTYSPKDRAFVSVYQNQASNSMDLVFMDVEDMECYAGESLNPLGYYASLDCIESYAEDNAPSQAVIDEIKHEKSSLSGEFVFTASAEVYDGSAINNEVLTMSAYLDDELLSSQVCTPGQKVSLPFTTTQGNHSFSIVPEFKLANGSTVKGPETRLVRWIGNDNPLAVTNVKYDKDLLTWTAPGAMGYHAGYVDVEALEYDVYLDGKKQNAEPLKECKYTFENPGDLTRYAITVTATANGMTSEPSRAISEVLGSALALPQTFVPTADQANLFSTYIGRSNYDFNFVDGAVPAMGLFVSQYTDTPDNWLFLPKMSFPSKEHLYSLAFTYSNFYTTSEKNQCNVKVYIGKEANPASMTELIIEREAAVVNNPLTIDALFAVPEAGDYYIGFYTGEAAYNNSRGIKLWNFEVNSLENVSSKSPGAAENVTVTPCPDGELAAVIECTVPTKAIDGSDLAADTGDITIKAECENGDSAEASGKPGDKVSLKVNSNADGFNFFNVTTYYKGERTVKRNYRAYLGIDTPLAPQNIRGEASADNKTLHLTWDPVTIGVNGGWVNPNTVLYEVSTLSGATLSKVGETHSNTFDFTPYDTSKQQSYYVGPVAVTEMGSSVRSEFANEFLGALYEVPMVEEFSPTTSTSFSTGPWRFKATDGFDNCPFSHLSSGVGLGIGDPALNGGAFICTALSAGSRWGELRAPKVTTTGINETRIGIRYWDYFDAATMYIYGRRYGQSQEELLFTINPDRPSELGDSHWVDWNEVLPEAYQNCPWVQLYVRCQLTGGDYSYCLLDNYRIYQDVDHDFRITGVSGPASAWAGETPTYSIIVNNSGLEAGRTTLVVRYFGDNGDQLGRMDVPVRRLTPAGNYTFSMPIEIKPEYLKYKELKVTADIEDEEDQVEMNNHRECTVALRDNQLPLVTNMYGSWNDAHDTPTITWDEPDTEYGDLESFEFETPFEITGNIGDWINVDMDEKTPFAIEGANWPDSDKACGWQVFDPTKVGILGAERYTPISGKNCIMARSCAFIEGVEDPTQSADWLISPEVVGGTDVTFQFCTGDSQYTETVEIWYSTGSREIGNEIVQNGNEWTCGEWKRLRPFSKSGTDVWEECSFTLPKDAKYFAFVYRSWGQFNAMIDDISFTRATPKQWEIVGYDVYRRATSGDLKGSYENVAWHTADRSVSDAALGDNNASYYVHTVVRREDGKEFTSPRGTGLNIYALGVDNVDALNGVHGGHGEIIVNGLSGREVAVFTADGKCVRQLTITDSRQSIPADAGVFIVKSGDKIAKVVVK